MISQLRRRSLPRRRPLLRRIVWIAVPVLGVFIIANVLMALVYQNKVLPNYTLGDRPIGNIAFDRLDEQVPIEQLLPANITLQKDQLHKQFGPRQLGIGVDWSATKRQLEARRSWLPLTALVWHHHIPLVLQIDKGKFGAAQQAIGQLFARAALPERIVFRDSAFAIATPEDGFATDDAQLQTVLVARLEQGKQQITVPTVVTHATEPSGTLGGELARLQQTLSAKITLTDGTHQQQLTASEIGRFYESSGQTMRFSTQQAAQVASDIAKTWGLTPINQGQAAVAAEYAINKSQPVTFRLANASVKVYRYCTAVKGGVSESVLPAFREKLAAVYGDPRSWNQAGIAFVNDESNCDYTAWLSSAAAMTTFSASICDNYYSCRVGPNVIINYDRWMGATDPWNAAHGSLEDYRVMVINHETGHWLGFAHRFCPGPGQPAPVMQQQSIDLQGCTFNPWPTPAELAAL